MTFPNMALYTVSVCVGMCVCVHTYVYKELNIGTMYVRMHRGQNMCTMDTWCTCALTTGMYKCIHVYLLEVTKQQSIYLLVHLECFVRLVVGCLHRSQTLECTVADLINAPL